MATSVPVPKIGSGLLNAYVPSKSDQVLVDLNAAAAGVVSVPDRQVWEYGWAYEKYRHSGQAALSSNSGPVTIALDVMGHFESAVLRLASDQRVRCRWGDEELWGVVAALVVAASERQGDKRVDLLKRAVDTLRTVPEAFISQLIANVSWSSEPLSLGRIVLGTANDDLFELAEAVAGGRGMVSRDEWHRWLADEVSPRGDVPGVSPTAICGWTVGQDQLAVREAGLQLRNVVDLPLLLERDLAGRRIFRHGDVNRPDVRGLALDRRTVENGLAIQGLQLELAARPLIRSAAFNVSSRLHWYSTEPLPLSDLYQQSYLREAVIRCLEDRPIGRRLRVAARWFAEAHYANAIDDAALALGVCMDALLSGTSTLPGGVLQDRCALLCRDPTIRRAVRKQHADFYRVRSSVAHGGRSSSLTGETLGAAFALAHATAWRLLDLDATFVLNADSEVDVIFDDLRLGIRTWP